MKNSRRRLTPADIIFVRHFYSLLLSENPPTFVGGIRSEIHCGGLGSKAGQQRQRIAGTATADGAIRAHKTETVVTVATGRAQPPVDCTTGSIVLVGNLAVA